MKLAVFASGNGSNFQAIADAIKQEELDARIVLLFCDRQKAGALERARRLGIPAVSFSPQDFPDRRAYEQKILDLLQEKGAQWIVLAGYMRIVGPDLLSVYRGRIVNIHPSLLPAFPGRHGIRDAFEAGAEETGVTVHFIDEGIDTGPVIAQERVPILPEDTVASLEERIHGVEHRLYPRVLQQLAEANKDRSEKE